jgi:hypothetical protein
VVDVVDSGPAATVAKAKVNVKHGLTIALRFSQPLDASTAANLADFVLVPVKKSKKRAPAVDIPLAASYDPSSDTVTLAAQAPVKRRQTLRLTVIGSVPDGIVKMTGLPLAGDGVHAGTNYVATITGGTIRQTNKAPGKTRGKIVTAAHQGVRMTSKARPTGPLALRRDGLEKRSPAPPDRP